MQPKSSVERLPETAFYTLGHRRFLQFPRQLNHHSVTALRLEALRTTADMRSDARPKRRGKFAILIIAKQRRDVAAVDLLFLEHHKLIVGKLAHYFDQFMGIAAPSPLIFIPALARRPLTSI